MERLPERARLDAKRGEMVGEPAPINSPVRIEEYRVQPERALCPRSFRHPGQPRSVCKRSFVTAGNRSLRDEVFIQQLELRTSESGLNVGQPVVVADLVVNDLDWIVLRLGGQLLRFAGPRFVRRNDHSATAGRNELVPIEAETSDVAERADAAIPIKRTEAFRCVFNHAQSVLARYIQDWIEIDGMTEDMDGEDRAHSPSCFPVDQLFISPFATGVNELGKLACIHFPISRLGVDEHRPRTRVSNRVGRRYERQARNKNFVV